MLNFEFFFGGGGVLEELLSAAKSWSISGVP